LQKVTEVLTEYRAAASWQAGPVFPVAYENEALQTMTKRPSATALEENKTMEFKET